MKETPKRPGAHEEFLLRREMRQAGLLNRQIRGRPHGVAGHHGWYAYLRHKWGGRNYPPEWVPLNGVMRPPLKTVDRAPVK